MIPRGSRVRYIGLSIRLRGMAGEVKDFRYAAGSKQKVDAFYVKWANGDAEWHNARDLQVVYFRWAIGDRVQNRASVFGVSGTIREVHTNSDRCGEESYFVKWDNGDSGWFKADQLMIGAPRVQSAEFAKPSSNPAAQSQAEKRDKPNVDMLMQFPKALSAVSEVLAWAESAKGYGFQSFLKLPQQEIRAALIRHALSTEQNGMGLDKESKKLHAVHVLANALMYVERLLSA